MGGVLESGSGDLGSSLATDKDSLLKANSNQAPPSPLLDSTSRRQPCPIKT